MKATPGLWPASVPLRQSVSDKFVMFSDADNLHEDLADLQCEISIKQKLIDELELSQKRLHAMRSQYEEKLQSLTHRIKETETERDKVLHSLGKLQYK